MRLCISVLWLTAFVSCGKNIVDVTGRNTFTNPIVEDNADPWVTKQNEYYYYCYSSDDKIYVNRSINLHEIGKGSPLLVWEPPQSTSYSHEIWAPELHYLEGKWYIYFSADDGDNNNHKTYVLEGSSQDPTQPFLFKGRIYSNTDRWAIDGSILKLSENDYYFLWSGWDGFQNVDQRIFIAKMSNPWTISGDRVLISEPTFSWERKALPINEGPTALHHNGKIFIIYSASGSWTNDYCLGQLTFLGGDILNKKSWTKKENPVFASTKNVFGPGHASFTKSPDDNEDWVVYHAAKKSNSGWDRNVRIQKFTFDSDNQPQFDLPVAEGEKICVPSGSK